MAESLTPDNLSAIVDGVVAKLRDAPLESLARNTSERSGEGSEDTTAEGADGPGETECKFAVLVVLPPPSGCEQ